MTGCHSTIIEIDLVDLVVINKDVNTIYNFKLSVLISIELDLFSRVVVSTTQRRQTDSVLSHSALVLSESKHDSSAETSGT